MLIIPAIDIINGECVRLKQGQFDKKTVYNGNPVAVAKKFVENGVKFLHIVDLDGAAKGRPKNQNLILRICRETGCGIQIGGGIRGNNLIKRYLEAGAERIVLGTKALTDWNFLSEVLSKYGIEKIVVAVDCKERKVMIDGWQEEANFDLDFCLYKLKSLGLKRLMVTDVTRDGTLERPNFELIEKVVNCGFCVIAAGGVSNYEDVAVLEKIGVEAVVVGKAFYDGKFDPGRFYGEFFGRSNLAKRIIPCLDVKDGRVVKGVNFINLKDAGDPVELAKRYAKEGADELVFLDITASKEDRMAGLKMVEKVAKEIFIPFTVGGGIGNVGEIGELLNVGADKVAINSAAVENPELIRKAARQFGSQCVVVAIDARRVGKEWKVFVKGGSKMVDLNATEWCEKVQKWGAGEILLTSMDRDGTVKGFDMELLSLVLPKMRIPVIASGGAGNMKDFLKIFNEGADGALAASIFHYGKLRIGRLKKFLKSKNITVRI